VELRRLSNKCTVMIICNGSADPVPRPRFSPGERTHGTHCTGGWVVPWAGLDTKATGKTLSPLPGIESRSSGRPARSQTLYWLSYLARAIPVTTESYARDIFTFQCSYPRYVELNIWKQGVTLLLLLLLPNVCYSDCHKCGPRDEHSIAQWYGTCLLKVATEIITNVKWNKYSVTFSTLNNEWMMTLNFTDIYFTNNRC
jgi:hypothetical protein